MQKLINLRQYNLILIRYNEIWLKSQKVKMRMLKILMDNIKNILNRERIAFHKYQLSSDSTRIFFFFKNEDIPNAVKVLKKVFGIYSLSPALRTSSKLKNIKERIIKVCENLLEKGDTFALRVKRSGKHEFSSQDVAVYVGKAIIDHFSNLELKVNLSNPKKKIFIEVRDEFAYIFTQIFKSKWGGLPIEPYKKILIMDIGRINDIIAGFLLMRRGCVIYPILFNLTENNKVFEKWLSNWREIGQFTPFFKFRIRIINLAKIIENILLNLDNKEYICAICRLIRWDIISKILKNSKVKKFNKIRAISDGVSLNSSTLCSDNVDLESISLNYLFSEYPIFTPLIGLDKTMIQKFQNRISRKLLDFDYCQYKPKNQEFNDNVLESLYRSLNVEELIKESIESMEEFDIMES
ncbi:MAG: THUMP domain-containing protein [Promethearchaeota archaeon]